MLQRYSNQYLSDLLKVLLPSWAAYMADGDSPGASVRPRSPVEPQPGEMTTPGCTLTHSLGGRCRAWQILRVFYQCKS